MADPVGKKLEFPHYFVQGQGVQQLFNVAKNKLKEKTRATKELDILWEECCALRSVEVGYACADAIVALTGEGLLDVNKVISTSVNYASSAKNIVCLLYIISKLLQIHALDQDSTYSCPYNLRAPPHPLISVIACRPNSWLFVESQIEHFMENSFSSPAVVEVLKPVILYVLLIPSDTSEIILNRCRLLQFLFRMTPKYPEVVKKILWPVMVYSTPDIHSLGFYEELACQQSKMLNTHCTAITVLKVLKFCQDDSSMCGRAAAIRCVKEMLPHLNGDKIDHEMIFVGIALILGDFPGSVLHDILDAIEVFLGNEKTTVSMMHLEMIRVALLQLQLLTGTNSAQKRTISLLKKVFSQVEDRMFYLDPGTEQELKPLDIVFTSDLFVTQTVSISVLIKRLAADEEYAILWLYSVEKSLAKESLIQDDVSPTGHILAALFLHKIQLSNASDDTCNTLLPILNCLGMLSRRYPKMSYSILPVLIYALKQAKGKVVQAVCNLLPSLACHSFCVAPVLNIIKSLSTNPSLKAAALRLMLDLWRMQDRCYPQLQKMLAAVEIGVKNKGDSYEFSLIKAIAISTICQERPHQYGSDMLKLINPMLISPCVGKCEVAITAFVLDGLFYLCQNKVLNLVTMWEQIGPNLQSKPEGLASKKVLEILSFLPDFKTASPEYDSLQDNILTWIWSRLDSRDVVTVGATLRCLPHFNKEEFRIKHLPLSLRPVKMEDISDEEFLDKQAPGSCFLKLLLRTESSNSKDIEELLSSLLKQELQDLPRDIHHRAMKSQLQASQPKPLKSIPEFIMTSYERNKQPSMKGSLASSLLLCYTSSPELDSAGNAVPKSVVSHGRKSMDILQTLLKEVTINPNDWQNLLWGGHAWKIFIKKCVTSMLQGRHAELVMQKSRSLDGSEEMEDFEHKQRTASLWCRDKIMNTLKSASKGNPSMQGNAVFGLTSLISALNIVDSSCEDNTQDLDTEYVKMSHWTVMALDTVMSIANPKHIPSGRIMSWCQYRAVSSTGKLSTTQLGKVCAIHSLPFLASFAAQKHSGKVLEMLSFLRKNDPDSESNAEFHRLLCLGHVLSVLYRENIIDQYGSDKLFLVQECLMMLYNNVNKCLSENERPLQDNLGSLLGFGLAISAKFQTSDPSFNVAGRTLLYQLLNHLRNEDLSPDSIQALATVLTWTHLSGFSSMLLNLEDMKSLIHTLQSAVENDPSKSGYCESLGTVCNGLFLCGNNFIVSVMDQLFERWHAIINKGRTPTREKLAALAGFCALAGANATLSPVAVDPAMLGASHYLTKLSAVVKTLRQLSRTSSDPGVPSRSFFLLGHLYMSLESNSSAIGSILPGSYDYLTNSSIMKHVFTLVSESVKPDSQSRNEILEVALNSIARNSWDFTLPPVNWTSVISAILSTNFGDSLKYSAFSVLLSQCGNSPNCASLLTAWISPKKFANFSENVSSLVYQNLDVLIKCQEDLKIAEFLEFLGGSCIELASQDVQGQMCLKMLDGLAKALKISSTLQPGVCEMLQNTVERLFQHLPFSPLSKLQLLVMQKLAHCAEFLPDANALVEQFEKHNTEPKDLVKSLFLRCCCTLNGTHSLSMCNNTILLCGESKSIRKDAMWVISVCMCGVAKKLTGSDQIEWLQELMGQVKKLVDSPGQNNIDLAEYLIDIFAIAMAFWSGVGSTIPIHDNYVEENVATFKFSETSVGDCRLLLPVSISRVLALRRWEKMIHPIVDWLSSIIEKLRNVQPESPRIDALVGAISAVRNTAAYQLPSLWCKVVSSVCQV